MTEYLGKNTPKLGFGFMRLPKLEDGTIDIVQVKEMVDIFMSAGLTYFDTAYVYDNGASEAALKEALVDRYPRDQFTVCTKLNAWAQCHDEESAKQQFYTSLKRVGVEYFDYYLMHSLMRHNYLKYDEYHIWDFLKELKQKGLVRHYGFSFHADPQLLDQLLTEHPEVDFIQLQINYADWDNPAVASRECYEVARRHGKPITIMEPVKGGMLANPNEKMMNVFKAAEPDMSAASWAIRYAASLDGVITVLSGMSSIQQVEDNVSYMKNFQPLNESQMATVWAAKKILEQQPNIPCTACHYCKDGCPMGIPIPEIFEVWNRYQKYGNMPARVGDYYWESENSGKNKPSACIKCKKCEASCPQHLQITELLQDCVKLFEK